MFSKILACFGLGRKDDGFSDLRFEEGASFRRARWGMTLDEVRGLEAGAPVFSSDTTLMYEAQVLGRKCVISYAANKAGKFYNGAYAFTGLKPEESAELAEKIRGFLASSLEVVGEMPMHDGGVIYDFNRGADSVTLTKKDAMVAVAFFSKETVK